MADAADACETAVLTLPETADLLRIRPDELEQLAERLEIPARRIGDAWRFNCASVLAWLNGDWVPAAGSLDSRRPLSAGEMSRVTGAGAAEELGPAPDDDRNDADFDEDPIGEAPQQPTAEDVLLRNQRVLVRPRDVSLNFGQFYTENDSLIFASSDEGNVLAAVEQAALLTTFQARIGISSDTELFLASSYFNQDTDVFLGNQKLASSGRSDFGKLSIGARHTLAREGIGRPNIIGTLTAQVPTNDTSYAIGGGLGFVKSFDPVALFASVNYTHTFSEEFDDLSNLEPEDRLDTSLGFALALNDTLSVSGVLSAVFTGATEFANAKLRQQDGYSLGFGLTSRVSQAIYLEPSVSLSLGGPADGFAFGVSVFTFKP